MAADPKIAAKVAAQYWTVVKHSHQHDITRATEDINGGQNSLKERKAAAAGWETKLAHGYKPGDPEPGQTLQDKHHPGHALYGQALHKLQKWNHDHHIKVDPQNTRNAAAALAVEARHHGLTRIDLVAPNDRGDKLIAVQEPLGAAPSKVISVDTVVALNTPMAQSSQAFTVVQQTQPQAPPQSNQQAQQQTAPAMSR